MSSKAGECLYTSQGEYYCKKNQASPNDMFYGKSILEPFYDLSTGVLARYMGGCYQVPTTPSPTDAPYLPVTTQAGIDTCNQYLANIAVDKFALNNTKACGVKAAKGSMSLCSTAPYNMTPEWFDTTRAALTQNFPSFSYNSFTYSGGRVNDFNPNIVNDTRTKLNNMITRPGVLQQPPSTP